MKKITLLFCLVFSFVTISLTASPRILVDTSPKHKPEAVKGEILIRVKGSVVPSTLHALHRSIGAKARSNFTTFKQFQMVKLPEGLNNEDGIKFYQSKDYIQYAEPNFIYTALESRDPDFEKQWGLSKIGAPEAWKLSTGDKKVVVAVIDTGVDHTHVDLKENIWVNTKEIAGNGIDDDGNGYIDDTMGWDFYGKDNDPVDDHDHGTHCAGIIGALHNKVGMMGVAANVQIMPIKFLGAAGNGTLEAAILSTEYAIQNGADILSNSWGGDGFSQAMYDVIAKAEQKGIIYVAAAGNSHSNNDTEPTYPASYNHSNVISVAATDELDQFAHFSNWGKETVHLAAPGLGIYSSVRNNQYRSYSGTSMACPHVAGAAAVLKAHFPEFSVAEIKERLMNTVEKNFYLERLVKSGGRLNLYNALMNITPPPPPKDNWTEVAHYVSSPHNYPSLSKLEWKISHPGAKYMRIHFAKLITEKMIDYVGIKDANGRVIETVSGNQGEFWSRPVPGDSVTIILRSDSVNEFYGFDIDRYAYQTE